MSNKIDYLTEDPPIDNQKYALISIVGPHMPQKCKVWGIKIRGVSNSLESSKELAQRLIKIDDVYDIYTVEVGKFVPLDVTPDKVKDIEYQNEQLNTLVKEYLHNRQVANDEWLKRKNEMVQKAVEEGKSPQEKPEHPISVLNRIRDLKQRLKETQKDLQNAYEKIKVYSDEEKTNALNEFSEIIKSQEDSEIVIKELMEELNLH
jgi:hypothetical protein